MTPYRSAAETATDRVGWVTACLARLVNEGRSAGWLEGAPIVSIADSSALHAAIEARVAITPSGLAVTPMQWLAARLGLSGAELAVQVRRRGLI